MSVLRVSGRQGRARARSSFRWWVLPLLVLALALGLTACGGSGAASSDYGGAQNHVHDILALAGSPNAVLVATHIGLYRTADGGQHWTEVAGGEGQAMDGLMLYKLAQSPTDAQRVYLVAIPRPDNPKAAKATPGIYTSDDAGKTWKIAVPASHFPSGNIFSIATGAQGSGQVFAILPSLGNQGVYVSTDTGQTWRPLSPLPTSNPTGILASPTQPSTLYLWSISQGLFVSTDEGLTWSPASGVTGGVYSVSAAGSTVYVMGDSGLYRSQDSGAPFSLVDGMASYSAVHAAPGNPHQVYAVTGTAVLVSTDAGTTWHNTAALTQHPTTLSIDPHNAQTVYVALSYPVGIEKTTDSGKTWVGMLP